MNQAQDRKSNHPLFSRSADVSYVPRAVNASALAVVLDGVSYAIPVRGFARDNSSISSGAGRRLLGRLAGHGASEAAADDIAGHDFMAKQLQPLHRRQLAQEPSSMYSIQLVISKCSSDLPVLGATVSARPCVP